jgi:S-DNA-T family DNA segregation ATPase FtsK/SpoIIIE
MGAGGLIDGGDGGGFDELFDEAVKLVVMHQQGSISLIQRRLKVGYSRAARLIDEMEQAGIVGAFTGSKAREVLVDKSYLDSID